MKKKKSKRVAIELIKKCPAKPRQRDVRDPINADARKVLIPYCTPHMRGHTVLSPDEVQWKKHICKCCGELFDSADSLFCHCRYAHPTLYPDSSADVEIERKAVMVRCRICNGELKNTGHARAAHLRDFGCAAKVGNRKFADGNLFEEISAQEGSCE